MYHRILKTNIKKCMATTSKENSCFKSWDWIISVQVWKSISLIWWSADCFSLLLQAQLDELVAAYKKAHKVELADEIEKKCSGDLKALLLAKLGKGDDIKSWLLVLLFTHVSLCENILGDPGAVSWNETK